MLYSYVTNYATRKGAARLHKIYAHPNQSLNSKNSQVRSTLESLERKASQETPHEEQIDEREATDAFIKLSEISLHDFLASEPDFYTDADLKVRYR